MLSAQQEWLNQTISANGLEGEELPVAALRAMPEGMQRHAIHEWLRRQRTPQVSFALVESIRALLPAGATKAKVNLPGGKFARRRAGRLFVADGSAANKAGTGIETEGRAG